MTPFLLTLCKHSLLAAAVLALAAITKPLWRERYGARSRCALWLALAVFLLLPVDWSAPNAPVRVEPPAERTLLLSAQRGPSVVRTDELPRRQETVLSGAEDTSPLPADPPVTFEEAEAERDEIVRSSSAFPPPRREGAAAASRPERHIRPRAAVRSRSVSSRAASGAQGGRIVCILRSVKWYSLSCQTPKGGTAAL